MPENRASDNYIQDVEDIAGRHCVGVDRIDQFASLALFLKFRVNWRTLLHSDNSSRGLWNQTEIEFGDMDMIFSMTNEFMFRNDLNRNTSLWNQLANSLAWSMVATGIPDEERTFSKDVKSYMETLSKNPWAGFLYLLSMSDFTRKIIAAKAALPPASPRKDT